MEIPVKPEAVTSEWLTAALRSTGTLKESSITDFEISGHQAMKSIIGQVRRIDLEYDRNESGAPHSLIAKFPTSDPDRRDYFMSLGMYEREVRFYEDVADRIDLRTPACYYSALDVETGRSILLLEDLSPATSGNRVEGCLVEEAAFALQELSKLHILWWENPALETLDWLQSYDLRIFQERYRQAWQPFRTLMENQLPNSIVSLGSRLSENLSILAPLWQPPRTLIHRDYQLDNLFFRDGKDGRELVVIDWQLIMRGRGVFDVANFVCWNLKSPDRQLHEKHLLRLYHKALTDNGIEGYSFDHCFEDYRLSVLECLARIVAVMGQGVIEDNDLLHMLDVILQRTVTAIHDLNVGDLVPE